MYFFKTRNDDLNRKVEKSRASENNEIKKSFLQVSVWIDQDSFIKKNSFSLLHTYVTSEHERAIFFFDDEHTHKDNGPS